MKIAFVCESLSFGGIERVISILSDSFVLNRDDVTIITTVDNNKSYELNQAIHTYNISYNSRAGILKKVYQKISDIRRYIRSQKYDVFICFGYKANVYTLLATVGMKCKKVISERNDPDSYGNKWIRLIRNIVYRLADLMVCQTEYVEQYYMDRGLKRCIVIPNPIKSNLPDRYTGIRDKRIVNFCRLNKQKNLPLLIDAFEAFLQNHNDYNLDIYGEGTIKQELLDYIKKKHLSDKIKLFGFKKNIHEVIIKSAMFVSSSDYEGISNSMLEALAIGLPTICTDCPVGGASLAISSGKNGILVPIKDKEALANAMDILLIIPLRKRWKKSNGY